jgi:hypothetical protein
MYSAGKAALEREKNAKVPEAIVPQVLGEAELTQKAKDAQAILEALNPILETRRKQQEQMVALVKAVDDYSTNLQALTESFQSLRSQLSALIDAKNVNATKEQQVLDKLIAFLP